MSESIAIIVESSESKNQTEIRTEITKIHEECEKKSSDFNLKIHNEISIDPRIPKTEVDKNPSNSFSNLFDDEITNDNRSEENRDENDEKSETPTRIKKKYRKFLNSDSEEENNVVETTKNRESDEESNRSTSSDKNFNKKSNLSTTKKKRRRLVESDSDEDSTIVETNDDDKGKNSDSSIKKNASRDSKSRFRTLVDSESEEERETNDDETKSEKKNNSKLNTIVDSESEYENDTNNSHRGEDIKKSTSDRKKNVKSKKIKEKSKFNELVDTDSEEDNEKRRIDDSFNKENETDGFARKSGKKEKKRAISARAAKDEAMRQIHSETQRLIRSSAVSLPYHRPKQRTLQDFLNRKKFIPELPEGLTTAAKVKMSTEIVGKVLEEKEKEAELFYKSSDSEDEKSVVTPMISLPNDDPSSTNKISIEETQKIFKNDLQNAHSKKEIIQQAGVEIGAPRKLFVDEPSDHCEKSHSMETEASMNDDDETTRAEPRKKAKESKQGMRDGNAPRKLFSNDCNETADSPCEKNVSVVSNDDEVSSSMKKKNAESDAEDEGVHSLNKSRRVSSSSERDADEFTLKFVDSELSEMENCRKIDETNSGKTDSINGLEEISETPFISNKEYARLNEREKSSKREIDDSDDEETSEKLPYGHVLGLPPPDIDEPKIVAKTSETRKKLLASLSRVGPKLRGSPGTMIDLTNDSRSNADGVKSLVDRFMRHSTINKPANGNSSITVLHTEKTAEGVKIIEEIIPYKLPMSDAYAEKELQKPGAKYKRLRMNLIETMTKKRGEEWKLRESREKDEDDVGDDEDIEEIDDIYEKSDKNDKKLDDSTESEPEIDDSPIERRKKMMNRQFADEEAEVSGDEDDNDQDEDEDEDDISLRVDNEDDFHDDLSENEVTSETMISRTSRIAKAFEDDSNSQPERSSDSGIDDRGKILQRTITDVDIFDNDDDRANWSDDNETEFPPSQILHRDQADARSQLCKTPLTAINALRFVSPITQLTALNSGNDSPKESPSLNDASLTKRGISGSFADKTPNDLAESPIIRDNEKRSGLQKKLFQDPAGTVNDEELMGLCSGKFTGLENEDKSTTDRTEISYTRNEITETQLFDLCSGSFPSQNFRNDEDKLADNCSRDFETNDDDNSRNSNGDESMETRRKNDRDSSLLKVVSSSEEEEENSEVSKHERRKKITKRKKVQKLELSDEEDEDEIFNDDNVFDDDENDEKYVDYDSDENEIVVVPRKDLKNVAANFVDAEAELSESEWGSEDEDEKDLDRLEFEEADEEDIDDNEMRDQLGKIHMRRLQDDDKREVRMLQELLFEDGDLHTDGSGRERKFRWKNIDQLNNDEDGGPRKNDVDDNGDPQEDENDLEWRIERIEREKFIEDKLKHSNDELTDELADDSQVFKLGIKALKRSKSNQNSQKEPAEPVIAKPIATRTVLDLVENQSLAQNTRILHKAVTRGSFLARGDECLARLAVHIKETSETTSLTRKNPKKFVFTHISPLVETNGNENDDALIENSSENSKGKKRKSTSSVTPRTTKKARVDANRKPGKTLF